MTHIDVQLHRRNLATPAARRAAVSGFGRSSREAPGPTAEPRPEGAAKHRLDVFSTGDTGLGVRSLPKGFYGPDNYGPFRVDKTRLGALQARALSEGALRDEHGPIWDVSGKGKWGCSDPLDVQLLSSEQSPTEVGSSLRLLVRCRKCDSCKNAKSAFWKLRAMAEIERSPRSWFVTLTWRPSDRVRIDYAAARSLAEAGIDKPTVEQRFHACVEHAGPVLTKYLKRVRKGLMTAEAVEDRNPLTFRYLLVWEAHDSDKTAPEWRGFPHAHLLLHQEGLQELTWQRITDAWHAGFSKVRLVGGEDFDNHKAAAYTCKYIAKELPHRVRASQRYGVNS